MRKRKQTRPFHKAGSALRSKLDDKYEAIAVRIGAWTKLLVEIDGALRLRVFLELREKQY